MASAAGASPPRRLGARLWAPAASTAKSITGPAPPRIPGERGVDRRSRAVARWLWDGRSPGIARPAGTADGKGDDMTLSEQIDALQAKVAELKSSLDASRHETNEQIKARVASARAKAKAAQDTVHGTADQAHTQWQSFKADTSAKMAELQGRIERKREERDAKAAEDDAEWAEANAADALDYAAWA